MGKGADSTLQNSHGLTTLHDAIAGGDATVRAMKDVTGGLNAPGIDAVDSNGRTCLHLAASSGCAEIVNILLEEPGAASPFLKDNAGNTPLHCAAAADCSTVIALLLKAGAKKDIKNNQNQVPVQLCTKPGPADLLQVFIKEEDFVRDAMVKGDGAVAGGTVKVEDELLRECGADARRAVQALFEATWKEVTTRDREFQKVRKFEVIHVFENLKKTKMKDAYEARKNDVSLSLVTPLDDIKTSISDWETFVSEPLSKNVNECYLFHGTKVNGMRQILENNFNLDLAGSNRGSLYGPGIYLAENSSKADEYAMDDKEGMHMNNYGMLLCRVVLGNPFITDESEPKHHELKRALEDDSKHSIIGDRERAKGTYREFVVRNANQVIPEFAIVYARR